MATQSYTASGSYTWTCPAGVTHVTVECWGGGGGGGSGSHYYNGTAGGGGGSGGYGTTNSYAVTPGTNYTVVVGQYGDGGQEDINADPPVGPSNGADGQDSYFPAASGNCVGGGGKGGAPGGAYAGTGGSGGSYNGDTGQNGNSGGNADGNSFGNGGGATNGFSNNGGNGGGYGNNGSRGNSGQVILTYTAVIVPTKVVFTTQPGGGAHGAVWSTQPVVKLEDDSGNIATTYSNAVTLALSNNPGSGTLTVTTNPLSASAGVASFSGCSINAVGSGYTLQATASGLTSATSGPFNILGIAHFQSFPAAMATTSGSARRKTSKCSAASIATMAGSMMRGRSLSSSLAAMAGSTGRATVRALAASVVAFAAALLAAHLKFSALTASLASMSGALYRQVARSLASGTATLGAVFTAARVARTFTQALPSSAAVFSASFNAAHRVLRSLVASMSTLAGSVMKQIQKSFGAN
jgi:hypothetical protein